MPERPTGNTIVTPLTFIRRYRRGAAALTLAFFISSLWPAGAFATGGFHWRSTPANARVAAQDSLRIRIEKKLPPRLKIYAKQYGGAYVKAMGEVVNTTILLAALLMAMEYKQTGSMSAEDAVKAVLSSEEVWTGLYVGKWMAGKTHLIDKMLLSSGVKRPFVKTLLSVKSNIICLASAELGAGMAKEAFKGIREDGSDGDVAYLFRRMKHGDFTPAKKVVSNLVTIVDLRRDTSRRLLARIFRDRVANLDFLAVLIGFGTGMVAGAKAGAFIGLKISAFIGHPELGVSLGGTIGGAIGAVLFGLMASSFGQTIIASIRDHRIDGKREDIVRLARRRPALLCRADPSSLPPPPNLDADAVAASEDGSTLSGSDQVDRLFSSELRDYLELREKLIQSRSFLFQRYGSDGKREKMRKQLVLLRKIYDRDLEMWDTLISLAERRQENNLLAWLITFENDSVVQHATLEAVLELMERRYFEDTETTADVGSSGHSGGASDTRYGGTVPGQEAGFGDLNIAP